MYSQRWEREEETVQGENEDEYMIRKNMHGMKQDEEKIGYEEKWKGAERKSHSENDKRKYCTYD